MGGLGYGIKTTPGHSNRVFMMYIYIHICICISSTVEVKHIQNQDILTRVKCRLWTVFDTNFGIHIFIELSYCDINDRYVIEVLDCMVMK